MATAPAALFDSTAYQARLLEESTARFGTLTNEPIPALLYSLHCECLTGLAVVEAAGGRSAIYFRDGDPVGVHSNGAVDLFGQILVETGVIDEVTRRQVTTARSPGGPPIGRALVAAGAITEEQLHQALLVQIQRRLCRLFFLEKGQYSIQSGEHQVGFEGARVVRAQPLHIIYQGIRRAWDAARLRTTFAALEGKALRLTGDPAQLGRYGFSDDDTAIARAISERAVPLDDLMASLGRPADQVLAVMGTLLLTQALELSAAPVCEATPEPAAHATSSNRTIVPPAKTMMAPDPLRSYTALKEATRRATAKPTSDRSPAQAREAALEAKMAFWEGEAHLRKREFSKAAAVFARAFELEPNEGLHRAHLAWARLSANETTLIATETELQMAALQSPKCARVHYFLGIVLKEQGEFDKAFLRFRKALSLDETMTEAQAEVRLHERRQERDRKTRNKGFFDRLLRR